MKVKALIIAMIVIMSLFMAGCGNKDDDNKATGTPTPTAGTTITPTDTAAPTATEPAATQPADAVSSASIVNDEEGFMKAISKDGTWIIAITKDLTIEKELTVEGDFKNSRDEVQRKLAFYDQDADRNITARYTLTAPKMTIKSPMCSIQHGTFKGDLYVSVDNFQLIDATVDGNVYFTTDTAKSTFQMDDASKVTGKQEVNK